MRYIKLKEWGISQSIRVRPSNDYMTNADKSLEQKDYEVISDQNGFMRSKISIRFKIL